MGSEMCIRDRDIQMPILAAIVIGIVFIALGVKTLVDVCKKK